jgi:hypothetical protein
MIDVNSIESKIKFSEQRYYFEFERKKETSTKISTLIIFFSLFFFSIIDFTEFLIQKNESNLFVFIYLSYAVLLIISIYYFLLTIYPKDYAFLKSPKINYDNRKNKLTKLYPDASKDEINLLVNESYLIELEKAIENNYEFNDLKSKYAYLSTKFAFLCIIPFIVLTILFNLQNSDTIYKIEIQNQNEIIMPDEEKEEKPSNVDRKPLDAEPRMVKESFEKFQDMKPDSNETDKPSKTESETEDD